jgi:hypothetical protein
MRKLIASLGAAALLIIIPETPAFASGSVVIDGDNCYGVVPDASGSLTGASVVGTYDSRTTKSGITNFTCHFDLTPSEAPSKNVKASGFDCTTPVGLTTNTRVNASPGGRMVMYCTIKK